MHVCALLRSDGATLPDNGALLASMAPLKTGDVALLAGDDARMTGDKASLVNIAAPWPGVFASVASNNSLLLVGGAPLACDGAHPCGFRARRTIARDILAKKAPLWLTVTFLDESSPS